LEEQSGSGLAQGKVPDLFAQVKVSVRRVVLSMASGYPDQDLFASVLENLQRAYHLQL
jgi:hypothetical protein